MFKLFIKNQGFSLVELLTVLAIIVTLAGVGISSFNKSVNRSRMTEAKNSLSFVYTSQTKFYNEWESYHSNLVAVGAVPQTTNLNYDVGFKAITAAPQLSAPLSDYISDNLAFLAHANCITWYKICAPSASCQSSTVPADQQDFNCSIVSSTQISTAVGDYRAQPYQFKAGAISNKVKSNSGGYDEWSINQDGTLNHP